MEMDGKAQMHIVLLYCLHNLLPYLTKETH